MKNMFRSLFMILVAFMMLNFTGCVRTFSVNGGEELVFIKKPFIWGRGGVDPEPLTKGLTWGVWSTSSETFNIKPVQYEEKFNDIVTKDNNPIDLNTYIELEIIKGKTPILYDSFGLEWYVNKVQETYRAYLRNLVSNETMFDLTSNDEVVNKLSLKTKQMVDEYLASIQIPVKCNKVTSGRAMPPADVIEETVRTASQKQREKTEDARADAELNRAVAERNKAIADKAYAERFGMTTDQYLQLRALEIEKEKIEMVKNKDNVSVIFGSGVNVQPMLNIK